MQELRIRPKERFEREVTLTPEDVSAFARAAGDLNPLHHDPAFAAASRYGRLLASGPQTSALLMSLTATHFSKRAPMVGLDFSFRFTKPVFADETVRLEWLVIAVRPNARLGGDLVDLRGRLVKESGETAVDAKGRVLVMTG